MTMLTGNSIRLKRNLLWLVFLLGLSAGVQAQDGTNASVREILVGEGWAKNSVNTVIFRKNSLISHNGVQYIAYYNENRRVMLGKRSLDSESWEIKETPYSGNASDAHNSISIIVDGDGFLHVAWDHHNNPLKYVRSKEPGVLELTEKMSMTGIAENSVSYPEFYKLPDGNLLFLYRAGGSGRGNLVINKYDLKSKLWTQLHDNLISGEGKRNAYWQAFVDGKGIIHVSWVWRETPDVASNHDLCYARSSDGGMTWEKSTGEKYNLPITASNAEYAWFIPQNSELINQTSMTAGKDGAPFIATYWRDQGTEIPQYRIVYREKGKWEMLNLNFRKMPFSLSGAGTKRIPISRPQVLAAGKEKKMRILLVFRDEERGEKISIACIDNLAKGKWKIVDLTSEGYGSWEPTYDTGLWDQENILSLFAQRVVQVDREGNADIPPQPVKVIQWKMNKR